MTSPRRSTATSEPIELGIDTTVRWPVRSRLVAAVLGILLGAFGAHRLYLGYKKIAAAQLAVTILTGGLGGMWGMYEGWGILIGKFGFDVAGHRLCHQALIQWLAAVAVGASVTGAGIAAFVLSDRYLVRHFPPSRGINSIDLSASMAQPESAHVPRFNFVQPPQVLPNLRPTPDNNREHLPTPVFLMERRARPSELRAQVNPQPVPNSKLVDLARPESSHPRARQSEPAELRATYRHVPIPRSQFREVALLDVPEVAVPRPSDSTSIPAASSLEKQAVAPSKVKTSSDASLDRLASNLPMSFKRPPLPAPAHLAQNDSKFESDQPNRPPRQSPERSEPVVERPPTETAAQPAESSIASRKRSGVETDALPTKITSPTPQYPPDLLARRVEGLVKLRVRVGADGRVKKASVYRSSGYRAFDRAAMDVIYQWRFEPARRAGAAFETEVAVPIRFLIDDQPVQR